MSPFLGTHQNRLDAKGRVSIPAMFRTALKDAAGSVSLILRPSHNHNCIEVWPEAAFSALAKPMTALDLFSEAHDDMSATIYADAWPVEPDKDGRVMLPDNLIAHAGLTEQVMFLGLGEIFHIWEPAAAIIFREAARERARANRLSLKAAVA